MSLLLPAKFIIGIQWSGFSPHENRSIGGRVQWASGAQTPGVEVEVQRVTSEHEGMAEERMSAARS
jgi:hypothetical protein